MNVSHLAPYLPYKLTGISRKGTVYELGIRYDIRGSGIEKRTIEQWLDQGIKPLLRPMNQLVEYIEHDGRKFMPIVEVFDKDAKDYVVGMVEEWGEKMATVELGGRFTLKISIDNPLRCLYRQYITMVRLHFDVFGLIDKGMAEVKLG